MNILNWARALITLSKNNNELNIYNYLNGELLASLQINTIFLYKKICFL